MCTINTPFFKCYVVILTVTDDFIFAIGIASRKTLTEITTKITDQSLFPKSCAGYDLLSDG
jgi:hypothetical protein